MPTLARKTFGTDLSAESVILPSVTLPRPVLCSLFLSFPTPRDNTQVRIPPPLSDSQYAVEGILPRWDTFHFFFVKLLLRAVGPLVQGCMRAYLGLRAHMVVLHGRGSTCHPHLTKPPLLLGSRSRPAQGSSGM